ncbi:MAG: HlyC/CorC family transporter [Clostridia bacterium]|nr:HlyC/CorC family transporter [Clostridia bacterium]
MNQQIIGPIILQVVLIALNAVFACAEIAVLSTNENKLAKMAEEGNKKARKLEKLTANPARFLATIQVAITLSGFLGSAFAADNFSEPIVRAMVGWGVPIAEETLDVMAVVVITILLSFVTLVFGELVPKRVAMQKGEQIALALSGIVTLLSKIFAPLVWLLTASTNGVLRLMRLDPNAGEEEVSEENIRMMADAGTEKGIIDEEENTIIQNVFEFNDLTVGEAMTHRTEAVMLWQEDPLEEWKKTIFQQPHTFYPVCEDTADHVIGVLDTRKFFRLPEQTKEKALELAVEEPLFASSHTKTDELFRQMKSTKIHFAVVIDEFGGTDGIITVNDLVELLVGELEETPSEIIPLDEFTYKIACDTELTKVERELEQDLDSSAATLSGWIVEQLGCLPQAGDTFHYDKFTFTVTAADEKRVLEAIVKIDPPAMEE